MHYWEWRLLKIYIYIYFVLCHVVSVWHGLVKALTVSNNLNFQSSVTLKCVFETLLFPLNVPSLTVIVILCLFGVKKVHNISSACGTMKWSATTVDYVCKDNTRVTIVCTFETLINQTSLHYLSVAIWGIIAVFEDVLFVTSQNLFVLFFLNVHTHLAASWPWTLKDVNEKSAVSVLCLCLWMKWSWSVYAKGAICQPCKMLIRYVVPFQKQYKVREAVADVPLYIKGWNIDDK